MNQKGISSLLLLIMVVLGVFIIWETTQFVDHYSEQAQKQTAGQGGEDGENQQTVCLTGETSDCNDSNDVFLLPEETEEGE